MYDMSDKVKQKGAYFTATNLKTANDGLPVYKKNGVSTYYKKLASGELISMVLNMKVKNASGAVMALVLPPGGGTAEAAQAVDRRSGLGRDGEKTGETSTRRGFGGRSLETLPHFLRTVAQSSWLCLPPPNFPTFPRTANWSCAVSSMRPGKCCFVAGPSRRC